MMKAIRNNIPNAITSLNLLFGCMACIAALSNGCLVAPHIVAFWFIALSAVADFLDGLVARWLHAVSAIGKELDSLADLVSFGLAPALILYSMMPNDGPWAEFALLLPVFGALRLARFNVDTNQATTFTGLPIPAMPSSGSASPTGITTSQIALSGSCCCSSWCCHCSWYARCACSRSRCTTYRRSSRIGHNICR